MANFPCNQKIRQILGHSIRLYSSSESVKMANFPCNQKIRQILGHSKRLYNSSKTVKMANFPCTCWFSWMEGSLSRTRLATPKSAGPGDHIHKVNYLITVTCIMKKKYFLFSYQFGKMANADQIKFSPKIINKKHPVHFK